MQANTQNWDEEVDLVAIGSGAGAMCAMLVADDQHKSALILEKEARVGGTSARSGGAVWIPFNHLMEREGLKDDYDKARQYIDACIQEYGPATTPERIDAYLKTGPEMLKFLEKQGLKFRRAAGYSDYYDDRPGGMTEGRAIEAELFDSRELGDWAAKVNRYEGFAMPVRVSEFAALSTATRTWRGRMAALRLGMRMALQKLRGAPIFGQGAALQGRLLKEVLARGIEVRLESPVTALICEGGTVTGVVARCQGKSLRVKARMGVLINAGGFSHNLEMRRKYLPQPQTTTDYALGNLGDTGEILDMAMALGAAVDQMDEAWWVVGSRMPNGLPVSHTFDMTKPHSIMVDANGDRYVNEAVAYMELGQIMYAHHRKTSAVPSWAILDSRHRERYAWGAAMPGKTPQEWFESGYMRRGDTLTELAEQCKLDPRALRATVDRFNGFAKTGVDEDFGRGNRAYERMGGDPTCKPNPSLGSIDKPPFYAVEIQVGDVGTCGGLVTDENGRVLRDDRSAIPGLYACGNTAASCMGRSYPGPGGTLGQSYIFGYRAARHALRLNT